MPKDLNKRKLPQSSEKKAESDVSNDVDNIDQIRDNTGLLNGKGVRFHGERRNHRNTFQLRPYWLGFGLFLILFAFWVLDSLKDPVFGALVKGDIEKHQPIAKLFSVSTTLILVCLLEIISRWKQDYSSGPGSLSDEQVLDEGGHWSKMDVSDEAPTALTTDGFFPISFIPYIGMSYVIAFSVLTYFLQSHSSLPNPLTSDSSQDGFSSWHVIGYVLYATIESFGSLMVASFWAYTNSTLSLQDAESFYGTIVAIAQLGAIAGSTMVSSDIWADIDLIFLACFVIVLHVLVMTTYNRRFKPTNSQALGEDEPDTAGVPFQTESSSLFLGLHLILRHNYVLLILGVSCLFEVSLTCLDYQMKLLGWAHFEGEDGLSFTEFMGRYGQIVNATSFMFSYIVFPWLLRRQGLRITLRIFPTLLVLVTVLAFKAIPANLPFLFISIAILKAMTYSIHDPATEILYLPTSNLIKFKAKFWIDIVGARVAKAMGSTLNTYAGSVDRSISVGSVPSLFTAIALWIACYRVGITFDDLVRKGEIVGLDTNGIHRGIYLNDDDENFCGLEAEEDPVSDTQDSPPASTTIELKDLHSK